MVIHCRPDLEGDLDRIHDQTIALELHLPSCEIETRNQLLVRAG